jgi:hypothetical protein
MRNQEEVVDEVGRREEAVDEVERGGGGEKPIEFPMVSNHSNLQAYGFERGDRSRGASRIGSAGAGATMGAKIGKSTLRIASTGAGANRVSGAM